MHEPPARLRAFISGTQQDLRPERDAAAAVLTELGFEVLRAETATSAAASSQSVCEGFAASCDLYVGIFGLRYGSVPATESMSVTEMEFNIARAADPAKILVFRQAGDPGARQQQFLRRVEDFAEGYFRATPFDTLATLRTQLRDAVQAWMSERVRRSGTSTRRGGGAPQPEPVTERRRPVTEEDLAQFRDALAGGELDERISALKDLAALVHRVKLEDNSEVREWIRRALHGHPETRVQAMRTVQSFFGAAATPSREGLKPWIQAIAREQFDKAKDRDIRAAALNLLGLVVSPEDLERLIEHVIESPPELYCAPFYALDALKNVAAVRRDLYAARREARDPVVKDRVDKLLEYIRDH